MGYRGRSCADTNGRCDCCDYAVLDLAAPDGSAMMGKKNRQKQRRQAKAKMGDLAEGERRGRNR